MSETVITHSCSDCGHNYTNPPGRGDTCPKCGSRMKHTLFEITSQVPRPIDEMTGAAKDTSGKVVAERLVLDDGKTQSSTAVDHGEPIKVTANRKERVSGFDDETETVRGFIQRYNVMYGSDYAVAPKIAEDGEYVDRWLVSESDPENRLPVQVRNLDTKLIAELGRVGRFSGERFLSEIRDMAQDAIDEKSRVDSGIRARTILLLTLPVGIGSILRSQLAAESFNGRGFLDVWICPFHDESFALNT